MVDESKVINNSEVLELRSEAKEKVKDFRVIDDAFFRLIASRKSVCQEILRTLLEDEKLLVISVNVQEEIVSLFRKIRVDALCLLSSGDICNIEMQKGSENDDIRRVRFHASSLTANKTPEGTEFKNVPNVKIIYISEYDALRNGQMLTHVSRCQKVGEEYKPIDDGEDIIFANTSIRDSSKKSKLLGLFVEKDCFHDEDFPELSNAVCYFKETEEGANVMKSLSERLIEEGQEIERANTEREKKRADDAEARADDAEARADAAQARADAMEEEIKKLKAELEKLKKKK